MSYHGQFLESRDSQQELPEERKQANAQVRPELLVLFSHICKQTNAQVRGLVVCSCRAPFLLFSFTCASVFSLFFPYGVCWGLRRRTS